MAILPQRPPSPSSLTDLTIMRRRASVMPLESFPQQKQDQIAAQVSAPEPPDRWLAFGPPGPRPLAWISSRAWYEWHWSRGIDPDEREGRH